MGHLVPYTMVEKEYLQLMENYKKSRLQIDGRPSLEFLRKHHAKPPQDKAHADIAKSALEDVRTAPTSPAYLPDFSEGEEEAVAEALNVDNRYVETHSCPLHEECVMKCLNPDEVCGALLFKCEKPGCAVFWTSDSHQAVVHQLCQSIHPTVHQGLCDGTLKCYCAFTPRMKLSRSEKNYERVFLTCFKKNNPCRYFQWIHWKVRPPQGPMDAFVQKPPRGRLYYTRCIPSEAQRQDRALQRARQTTQQLVRVGLDRFRKDNVQLHKPINDEDDVGWFGSERSFPTPRPGPGDFGYEEMQKRIKERQLQKTKETVESAWGSVGRKAGFVPSPGYTGDEFKRGMYLGNKSFADDFFRPTGVLFSGVKHF